MKRLFTLLMVAFVAFSCEMLDGALDSKGEGLTFAEGTETTASFKARGGSATFEFTADLDWTVTTSDEWITVTPESGSAGEGEIKVKVAENEDVEERTGYVDITLSNDKSFRIEVEQKEGDPIFEIGADGEIKVKAAGGEVEIEVTTNIDYEVYIPDDAESWIEYVETRSVRNETVVFSVSKNSKSTKREAVIELRDEAGDTLEEFTIEQAAAEGAEDEEPIFEVGDDGEYIVKATGGNVEVDVRTNLEYSVYIPKDVRSWIEYVETRSVRNETVVLSVAENDSEAERTAVIELRDASGDTLEEITIVQRGKSAEDEESIFEIGDNGEYIVEAAGGDVEIEVTTNIEYSVYIPKDVESWIEYVETRSVRNETVVLSVAENDSEAERTAVIELRDASGDTLEEITIVQRGEEPGSEVPNNEIWYTTTDGMALDPYNTTVFGANLVDNTYVDGKGVLLFDGDVTTIGEEAFYDCSSLTSITIPNSVTAIGADAFEYCSSLTSITIPDNVTEIGDFAFEFCSSLTSVTIPYSVTTIGGSAFYGCSSLTEFKGKFASEDGRCLIIDGTLNSFAPAGVTEYTIPDSVTEIGRWAFAYCKSLTSITIPDSVTTIGDSAFEDCSSLKSVYCKPTTPPSIEYDVFDGNASSRKIYVPAESVAAYKTAEGWSDYADSIVGYNFETGEVIEPTIPDNEIWYTTTDGMEFKPYDTTVFGANLIDNTYINGKGVLHFDGDVTVIGEDAFYDCSSLTSITIPDSVTEIGTYAFYECSSLQSVTIGNSVTTIGYEAFAYCKSLTSVTIPDSVTTIGNYAFEYCSSLQSVTIGNSVTTIGNYAFYECSSLQSVTIGNSVTTIGSYAFYNCDGLQVVDFYSQTLNYVGDSVFEDCDNLSYIRVPYQAYYTYLEAFGSVVMVVAYDYENDVEVDMTEPTDLAKRWIGTWSSTVQSTFCPETGEFDNTPVTFDIEITAHSMYTNRVLVTGLIVSNPSLALVGIVNDDGSLGILNYQEIYSDDEYMYFVSGMNEQGFLSMDDSNFAAYTMTMDDYGNVSCTVGTIDNLPIIMYGIFVLEKATGTLYFYDASLSYYSGPMTWERVGGDESDLEDSGEETPNEWSSTAPLFKQPKIDKTLSKKLSIASKRAM